ncbi:hypothetical protein Back2_09830 [Nocardioides baekrokdamisoli]|uniref:Lipoprotein n=1 Tax=Nocardioides baekrokdamisoli TaxID=1804624 RepID=A0A3G9IEC6_9ACTN|nr:lipocalin family protein [Nocardioides baekrokdamisoli]BBH16696.1 hypothetical protein Back2_09830 [Nocardioides baekrokdamisoli]
MRLTGLARGVLIAATASAVAGCGGSSSSGTPSTSPGATSSSPAVTTPAATPVTLASGLVGTWHADVHDLLAGTAALSHGMSFDCSGPVTVTFNADGTATDHLQMHCSIHGRPASGDVTSTGNYSVSGHHISFSNIHNTGGVQVMGITVPFPAAFSGSGADVSISGNQLSFDITAAGTTIHQVYHRG